jgi:hypothetical protein
VVVAIVQIDASDLLAKSLLLDDEEEPELRAV